MYNPSQILNTPIYDEDHEEERIMTCKSGDQRQHLRQNKLMRFTAKFDKETEEEFENISEVFDNRQLLIVNDLANFNVSAEQNFKEELRAGVGKQFAKKGTWQKRQSMLVAQTKVNKERKWVIDPHDRIIWDLFTMVVIFLAIVILPLDISFNINSDFFTYLNYATILIFTIDIFINFNTAYQYKGVTIQDRKLIAIQYLKLWFWIDLLSTFPFDLMFDWVTTGTSTDPTTTDEGAAPSTGPTLLLRILATAANNSGSTSAAQSVKILRILKFFRLIKVIRLLRLLKLKKIFAKFEDYIDLSQTMISFYQVLKLTFIMLYVAHWLACIWHFIGDQEKQAGDYNWLAAQQIDESSWYDQYVAAIYWATATMTTVGYGDIVPVTTIEKIFAIIVMLLACCIFAYIMNSIGGIFVTMDQNEKLIRWKMGQANQFLKSNDIQKELQARVRKYLEYKYEKESNQVDEKQALLVLSSQLRDEVLAEVNIGLIKESKIFQEPKFDKDFLIQLPFLLEEQIYGPEECIFLEGEDQAERENGNILNERCLYFLNQGQVMICIQKTLTWLKTLDKGVTFGELGFFSNRPRSASAYTLDFVYVQKLKKKDFLALLNNHNIQKQKYEMDKYLIEVCGDFTPLGLQCYGCKDQSHFSFNCPRLHCVVDFNRKLELIKVQENKNQLFAKAFLRHEKVKYNARGCLALTLEVAGEIKYVYHGDQEEDEDVKLQKLQFHDEDYPIEHPPTESKQIEMDPIDEPFDRITLLQEYFANQNADVVIKDYNKKMVKKLRRQSNPIQLLPFFLKSVPKSGIRSSSAENAQYFEKLIDKHGGAARLLDKLQQEQ